MKTLLDQVLARLPFNSTKISAKPHFTRNAVQKVRTAALAVLIGALGQGALAAPTNIMVPFSDGFFGDDDGNNTIDALDVQTFSDLGLAASFFQQISSTSVFEDDSTNTTDPVTCVGGNDVPGRLRIRLGGVFTDIPGCIDGKYKEGGATVAFSFNPKATGSITINAANPANNIVVNPTSTGLLNIGIVINNYSNSDLTPTNSSDANNNGQLDSGEDISGDSSGVLAALNAYLTTAETNAPNGSVSVDEKTYITPNAGDIVLTGSYDFGTTTGEELAVIVNGVLYPQGTSGTDVVIPDGSGGWTLTLSTDLADDRVYDVDAWIINSANWILQDSTAGELTILGAAPSISLVKTAVINTGADGILQAGETVTYTYVVGNTGAIDVTEVTIAESAADFTGTGTLPTASLAASPLTDHGTLGDSSDDGLDANYDLLASEDHVTFTATYTVTQADIDAGSLTNQATVTAKDPSLNNVTDTSDDGITGGDDTGDDPTVTGLAQVAAIEGTKTAAVTNDVNSDGFGVGDTVTYTVTATNTGNVTLTGVGVSSDTLSQADTTVLTGFDETDFTIESGGSTTLAPGASVSFTATYLVTQADIDAGGLSNTATVIGTPPSGAGNEVTDVTDDADDTDGNTTNDATELLVSESAAIEGTKTAAVTNDVNSDGFGVGDTVTYTVTATNTGNVTLTGVGVSSDTLSQADTTVLTGFDETDFTMVSGGSATLAPGASVSFTATYVVTQADIDAGGLSNTATVIGTPPSGADNEVTDVTDDADDTDGNTTNDATELLVSESAAIEGTKTAAVTNDVNSDGFGVGDTVTYTVTATNTGNVTLTSVGVSSDTLSQADTTVLTGFDETDFTMVSGGSATLAPGASVSFTATYVVTQADIDAGGLSNTATVIGTPPSGADNEVTDVTDDADDTDGNTTNDATELLVTESAAIEGTKTAAVTNDVNSDGFGVGDTITYTVTATNTGNVTLTGVGVSSDTLSQADTTVLTGFDETDFTMVSGGSTTLAPGASVSFTATYLVTQADIDAGGLSNTATVIGTPPSGSTNNVTDVTDDADDTDGNTTNDATELLVTATPGLTITKATTDDDGTITGAAVGTTVTWTVTATNTGNVSLTYGGFNDALTADADETYVGLDTDGDTTFDDTTALTSSSVLAPGQSWQWTVDYNLTQADLDAGAVENIASVDVSAPGDSSPTTYYSGADATASSATTEPSSGASVTIPQSALLKVTKTVDDSDLDDGVRVGDTLVYTIKVENLGNVTLKGVDLTDTFKDLNNVSLTLTSGPTKTGDTGAVTTDAVMEPGDVWTYAASFDLTQDVIDAGGVENIAMVSGYVDANGNDTKDTGETVVTAESKVGGNTSADGDGTPTETGFPGEVTGTVRNYMKGVEGITVYLLKETSVGSGVFDYVLDPSTTQPIMTTTDADGKYCFLNLPTANYGVEFDDPNSSKDPTAKSAYTINGNRITGIEVGAGEVEIEQDAFFVDPAGVVYDSSTYDPIQGAVVSLYHQPTLSDPKTLVLNSWLNTTLGDANEVTTGSDGAYVFLLDASVAQDGIYSLDVVKDGYTYVSSVIAPLAGPFDAGLGGGIVNISADATTYDGMDETYYTSFDMVFTGDAPTTSNGVAQNHLPMDPSALVPLIEDDLLEILKDDLAATMTQQSRQMGSFAKGALSRLKAQPNDTCAVDLNAVAPVLFDNDSSVVRNDQSAVLDELAAILETCEGTTFEIAGHTDSNASDAYNLTLSQARVDAIRKALVARGIEADRLVSQGYGESRPVADNATVEGRAANRRVEFVPMLSVEQADSCTEATDLDRSMTASISNRGVSASGDLYSERRDCASNSWRIVEGKASYLETTDGMAQGMLSLSVRRETLKDDDQVSGRFVGVYASQNSVTGLATGRITGYGINAGVYGAQRLQDQLYADYYLGAATGRHFFDLDFDRTGGTVGTTGHYDYTALFAGAALSGETEVGSTKMTPRVGVDFAYSPGGTVAVTAARGSVEDSANLSLPSISGMRAYAEVGFNDLTADEATVLSFTPKAFCDRPIGGSGQICGAVVSVEYSAYDADSGMTYGFKLDAEKSGSFTYGALSANYSVPLGRWVASGTASFTQDGNASLSQMFSLNF